MFFVTDEDVSHRNMFYKFKNVVIFLKIAIDLLLSRPFGTVFIAFESPIFIFIISCSLRKQPTFREVATWALAKRRLSNERRTSLLMTRRYPDLGSNSDSLKREGISFQTIRSTTLIWVVTRRHMEFLRSLLRRRFARRPRETSAVFSG